MGSPRDRVGDYDVSPEAVGEDRATRQEERSGFGGFTATQLKMWVTVLVLLVVGIAAIVFFASRF
jgi:hypothetical protein